MSSWWMKNSSLFHSCSTPGHPNGTTHREPEPLDEHAEVGRAPGAPSRAGRPASGGDRDPGGGDRVPLADQEVADQRPHVPRVAQGGRVRPDAEGGVAEGETFAAGEGGHVARA